VVGEALDVDVLIAGAGLGGAAAAVALGRLGVRTAVVDPHLHAAPAFKVEKLDQRQVRLLDRLGLLPQVAERAGRIRAAVVARRGRVLTRQGSADVSFGILYPELVGAIRSQIPAPVEQVQGRVAAIEPDGDRRRVQLDDGRAAHARLVVLATGTGTSLGRSLGFQRHLLSEGHSLTFGFDVERADRRPFELNALTYFPHGASARFGSFMLFPVRPEPGLGLRANFFTYLGSGEAVVRALIERPETELEALAPGLARITGPLRVTSKVEVRSVNLYDTTGVGCDGVLVIGDSYQTACPAVGVGVTKALTDAAILGELIRGWLATPGLGQDKLAAFYRAPEKLSADRDALEQSFYLRRLSTDAGLEWVARRERNFAGLLLSSVRARLEHALGRAEQG
jgi:2-polyprenyl-6-methoxyphenol hydroxylase-like FAD-dependent oxidoreductase